MKLARVLWLLGSTAHGRDGLSITSQRSARWIVVLGLVLLTAAKVWTATGLGLFGDEAFYWQSSQRPAIAYADHPFMTAMLVRAGTGLLGPTPLGVRLCFLVLGAAFPLVMFALARAVVGARQAWLAMGLSLVFLGTAHLGLVAIPDVPMLFFSALFLMLFERATRTDGPSAWIGAGLVAALGLATHYRFVLLPVAAAVYLTATTHGRARLAGKGPWVMAALGALGLVPFGVQNLGGDFSAAFYYLAGRHESAADLGRLADFFGEQLLVASPFLFVAFVGTLVMLIRRGRTGDDRASLFCLFALVPFGVFMVLSPFEDSGLATAHWPVVGYVPLLVFLPEALGRFVTARTTRCRRAFVALAVGLPVVALTAGLLEFAGITQLTGVRSPFAVGPRLAADLRRDHLPTLATDGTRELIVADNYKLGGHLEFALHGEADVYVLDHKRNHEHGRAPQLDVWDIGEAALIRQHGREALIVVDLAETKERRRAAWLTHVGSFFDEFRPVGQIRFERPTRPGRPTRHYRYDLYRGVVTHAPPAARGNGD